MKSKAYQFNIGRSAIGALCAALILLACLYVYFLSASILNVVMREEIEQDIVALSSTIGELEFEYLSLKQTIDLSRAHAMGLEQLPQKRFVTRHSYAERSLTLNQN